MRWPEITSVPFSIMASTAVRIDAGQGDENQKLMLGLEHVDRRLPAGFLAAENCWRIRSARVSKSMASDSIQLTGFLGCMA